MKLYKYENRILNYNWAISSPAYEIMRNLQKNLMLVLYLDFMLLGYTKLLKVRCNTVLYCLKCKKQAYKTHKCNIMELITIKKECKGIADGLYDLVGIGPLSVAHFVTAVAGATNKYYIKHLSRLTKGLSNRCPRGYAYWMGHSYRNNKRRPSTYTCHRIQ